MLILKSIAVWFVIILVEIIHGILRNLFLVPMVGDFRARQISVLTGSLLIFIISMIIIPWFKESRFSKLMNIGGLWVCLTVIFEFVFGYYVAGYSPKRILSDFDILHGGLLPLGLLFMLISPVLAGKLRRSYY